MKLEYRVKMLPRRYSWDPCKYTVQQRTQYGEWLDMPELTNDDISAITSAYTWGHYNPDNAIQTAKKLVRKHRKERDKIVSVTLAFKVNENKRDFLYVSTSSAWWSTIDPLEWRLNRYKSVKRHFVTEPALTRSVTAELDGSFNVTHKTENNLTVDFANPFLLKSVRR